MFNKKMQQSSRFEKRSGLRKYVLPVVFLLLVITAALFILEKTGVTNFYSKAPESNNNNSVNLEPPTEDEKQAGDTQKDKVLEDEEVRNNPDEPNKQSASVIITDAGQYDDIIEVRAFIPDHYQDGTCTITFVQNATKVSKSTPAYRDVSTTICTNPLFARSEFMTPGEWQLLVTYTSANASGVSESKNIMIR